MKNMQTALKIYGLFAVGQSKNGDYKDHILCKKVFLKEEYANEYKDTFRVPCIGNGNHLKDLVEPIEISVIELDLECQNGDILNALYEDDPVVEDDSIDYLGEYHDQLCEEYSGKYVAVQGKNGIVASSDNLDDLRQELINKNIEMSSCLFTRIPLIFD